MRLCSYRPQFLQLLPSLLNFVIIASSFLSDLVMKFVSLALLLCAVASASGSARDFCSSAQKACAAKGGAIKQVVQDALKFSEENKDKVDDHMVEWLKKVKDEKEDEACRDVKEKCHLKMRIETCKSFSYYCYWNYSAGAVRDLVNKTAEWLQKEGLDKKYPEEYKYLVNESKKHTEDRWAICTNMERHCLTAVCKTFGDACKKSHATVKWLIQQYFSRMKRIYNGPLLQADLQHRESKLKSFNETERHMLADIPGTCQEYMGVCIYHEY